MPRYAIEACRAHVTVKRATEDEALQWGVRNLRVPASAITVRRIEDQPPASGHNTPNQMKKQTSKKPASAKAAKSTKVPPHIRFKQAAQQIAAKKEKPKAAVKKQAADKPMSGLDAAAHVLQRSKEPMNAKQITACILNDGLAPNMKGLTPHATIYAAMITEIAKKQSASRFKRGKEKGTFTYQEPQA